MAEDKTIRKVEDTLPARKSAKDFEGVSLPANQASKLSRPMGAFGNRTSKDQLDILQPTSVAKDSVSVPDSPSPSAKKQAEVGLPPDFVTKLGIDIPTAPKAPSKNAPEVSAPPISVGKSGTEVPTILQGSSKTSQEVPDNGTRPFKSGIQVGTTRPESKSSQSVPEAPQGEKKSDARVGVDGILRNSKGEPVVEIGPHKYKTDSSVAVDRDHQSKQDQGVADASNNLKKTEADLKVVQKYSSKEEIDVGPSYGYVRKDEADVSPSSEHAAKVEAPVSPPEDILKKGEAIVDPTHAAARKGETTISPPEDTLSKGEAAVDTAHTAAQKAFDRIDTTHSAGEKAQAGIDTTHSPSEKGNQDTNVQPTSLAKGLAAVVGIQDPTTLKTLVEPTNNPNLKAGHAEKLSDGMNGFTSATDQVGSTARASDNSKNVTYDEALAAVISSLAKGELPVSGSVASVTAEGSNTDILSHKDYKTPKDANVDLSSRVKPASTDYVDATSSSLDPAYDQQKVYLDYGKAAPPTTSLKVGDTNLDIVGANGLKRGDETSANSDIAYSDGFTPGYDALNLLPPRKGLLDSVGTIAKATNLVPKVPVPKPIDINDDLARIVDREAFTDVSRFIFARIHSSVLNGTDMRVEMTPTDDADNPQIAVQANTSSLADTALNVASSFSLGSVINNLTYRNNASKNLAGGFMPEVMSATFNGSAGHVFEDFWSYRMALKVHAKQYLQNRVETVSAVIEQDQAAYAALTSQIGQTKSQGGGNAKQLAKWEADAQSYRNEIQRLVADNDSTMRTLSKFLIALGEPTEYEQYSPSGERSLKDVKYWHIGVNRGSQGAINPDNPEDSAGIVPGSQLTWRQQVANQKPESSEDLSSSWMGYSTNASLQAQRDARERAYRETDFTPSPQSSADDDFTYYSLIVGTDKYGKGGYESSLDKIRFDNNDTEGSGTPREKVTVVDSSGSMRALYDRTDKAEQQLVEVTYGDSGADPHQISVSGAILNDGIKDRFVRQVLLQGDAAGATFTTFNPIKVDPSDSDAYNIIKVRRESLFDPAVTGLHSDFAANLDQGTRSAALGAYKKTFDKDNPPTYGLAKDNYFEAFQGNGVEADGWGNLGDAQSLNKLTSKRDSFRSRTAGGFEQNQDQSPSTDFATNRPDNADHSAKIDPSGMLAAQLQTVVDTVVEKSALNIVSDAAARVVFDATGARQGRPKPNHQDGSIGYIAALAQASDNPSFTVKKPSSSNAGSSEGAPPIIVIPFQFNPEVSGLSREASWNSITAFGRSSEFYVWANTGSTSISFKTTYAVTAGAALQRDGSTTNGDKNDSYSWTADWTEEYIAKILSYYEMLLLPQEVGKAPPIITVVLKNDSQESRFLRRVTSETGSNSAQWRRWVCTSVAVDPNYDAGYSESMTPRLWDVSLNLKEVPQSWSDYQTISMLKDKMKLLTKKVSS